MAGGSLPVAPALALAAAFLAPGAVPAALIDNHAVWRDVAGEEIKAQGGCILQDGDLFHWIGPASQAGDGLYRNRFAAFHAASLAGLWTPGAIYESLPDGSGTRHALGDLGAYHDPSTGEAYLLYTFDKGEANGYQAIVKLSPDFRRVLPPQEGGVVAEFPKTLYYGQEAAALFKRGSTYYHIMSDTRGWRPSVTRYRPPPASGRRRNGRRCRRSDCNPTAAPIPSAPSMISSSW